MKRPLLILFLGLLAGTAAHFGYYGYHRPGDTDTLEGRLAWMKWDPLESTCRHASLSIL